MNAYEAMTHYLQSRFTEAEDIIPDYADFTTAQYVVEIRAAYGDYDAIGLDASDLVEHQDHPPQRHTFALANTIRHRTPTCVNHASF